MVQQETLAPPVQLAAEGVQLIVGLLAENQTCKNGGTDGRSPAACVCVFQFGHGMHKKFSRHLYFAFLPLKAARASSVGWEVSASCVAGSACRYLRLVSLSEATSQPLFFICTKLLVD